MKESAACNTICPLLKVPPLKIKGNIEDKFIPSYWDVSNENVASIQLKFKMSILIDLKNKGNGHDGTH